MKRLLGNATRLMLLITVVATASQMTVALASSSTTAVALTHEQAIRTVINYFKENNYANKTLSVAAQDKDEEGVAARADNAAFSILSIEGKTTDGTGSLPKAKNISVYLTGATRAPAEFLAAIKYPAASKPTAYPAGTSYFLFRKDSRVAPWRVAYYSSVSSKAKTVAVVERSGRARIDVKASANVATTVAKYLTTGAGKVAPGTYSSGEYNNQFNAENSDNGNYLTFGFVADSSPDVSVAVKGGTLEFVALDETETTLPGAGICGVDSLSSDSAGYLALVPSGVPYKKIVLHSLVQLSLFVPSGKHRAVVMLDAYYQMISAQTSPASGCSTS